MEQNSLDQKQTHEKEHWWAVTLMNNEGNHEGYLGSPHKNITMQRLQEHKEARGLAVSVVVNMSYLGYMTAEYFQS